MEMLAVNRALSHLCLAISFWISKFKLIFFFRLFFYSEQVITPQKCGDVYLYDLLPQTPNRQNSPYQNLSMMSDTHSDTYDSPRPSSIQVTVDSPRPWSRQSPHALRFDDSYDVPRPSTVLSQQNVTPSSSISSLLTPDSLSLSSSNRSSLANMPDYDIPRRFPHPARAVTPLTGHQLHLQPISQSNPNANSTYDVPLAAAPVKIAVPKELPLQLSSALETLAKLQNEASAAVTK